MWKLLLGLAFLASCAYSQTTPQWGHQCGCQPDAESPCDLFGWKHWQDINNNYPKTCSNCKRNQCCCIPNNITSPLPLESGCNCTLVKTQSCWEKGWHYCKCRSSAAYSKNCCCDKETISGIEKCKKEAQCFSLASKYRYEFSYSRPNLLDVTCVDTHDFNDKKLFYGPFGFCDPTHKECKGVPAYQCCCETVESTTSQAGTTTPSPPTTTFTNSSAEPTTQKSTQAGTTTPSPPTTTFTNSSGYPEPLPGPIFVKPKCTDEGECYNKVWWRPSDIPDIRYQVEYKIRGETSWVHLKSIKRYGLKHRNVLFDRLYRYSVYTVDKYDRVSIDPTKSSWKKSCENYECEACIISSWLGDEVATECPSYGSAIESIVGQNMSFEEMRNEINSLFDTIPSSRRRRKRDLTSDFEGGKCARSQAFEQYIKSVKEYNDCCKKANEKETEEDKKAAKKACIQKHVGQLEIVQLLAEEAKKKLQNVIDKTEDATQKEEAEKLIKLIIEKLPDLISCIKDLHEKLKE